MACVSGWRFEPGRAWTGARLRATVWAGQVGVRTEDLFAPRPFAAGLSRLLLYGVHRSRLG